MSEEVWEAVAEVQADIWVIRLDVCAQPLGCHKRDKLVACVAETATWDVNDSELVTDVFFLEGFVKLYTKKVMRFGYETSAKIDRKVSRISVSPCTTLTLDVEVEFLSNCSR